MFGGRKTLTGHSIPEAVDAAMRGPISHFPCGDALGVTADGVRVFKGIPYALPPVGQRRWRRPEPVVPWHGVRDAIDSGPACVQPSRRFGSIYDRPLAATSEDCLYLDIWAPEGARDLPVLVWIHGGSFIWGAGSDPLHDGAALARRGAVVVSINYRLGVFGYLAHPDLSAESPDGVSGNCGLLDQIAALAWVRDNIAAVGGDPGNVTVTGESAGALSVLYLLASPAARGLFAKAIAQSAYMISMPALRERRDGHEPAEVTGERLGEILGARNVSALRAIDAGDLADAALRAGFTPLGTIDGQLLPAQLVDVFERGHQAKVPLIAGFNGGEIRSLPFLIPTLPQTGKEHEDEIRRRYGSLAERFLALYGPGNVRESALASIRDALYGWTALKLAEAQKGIGAPAFVYLFDHTYPAASEAGLDAFHGCELPYLFGTADHTPPLWPAVPATKAEAALSRAMGDYWISFANAAAPISEDWPTWPDHTITGRHMYFADAPLVEADLMPGMFALADEVVRQRRNAGDVPWNWNVGVAAPLTDADTR
ncbi:carboxylesterase family protein [Mesorhizobium sp. J428]|uniref:carboxylesterase/lipase family protein n=1 Tax=Mesorhizobium sp. J428 TaxID=2898440 RepID=UPI0027E26F53|nr:carboxylesterase family protein [Mesorhizobium sp. J428]